MPWWWIDQKIVGVLGLCVGFYFAYTYRRQLIELGWAGVSVVFLADFVLALSYFNVSGKESDLFLWVMMIMITTVLTPCGLPFIFSLIKDEPDPEPLPDPEPIPQPIPGPEPFKLPDNLRTHHMMVVAGSGHGKSYFLEWCISEDIKRPYTVIVMDSQGDMLTKIANQDIARERIVYIDPTDVEWPVQLNPWDIHKERVDSYSLIDREKQINGVIELLSYTLASLGTNFTSKQQTLFNFTNQLMLEIPNATIHTLRELLSPGGYQKYQQYARNLSETAQAFFEHEFNSKNFGETKEQVVGKLYGLLQNSTFNRMFSHPKSKLDLFTEMNEGNKVILLNTSIELLKLDGSLFMSRLFTALVLQATFERAALHESERPVVIFYIDEAGPIINDLTISLLEMARKYNVGLVFSFQSLGSIPTDLLNRLVTSTAIKIAGGNSAKDARYLADDMRTTPESLMAVPTRTFEAFWKGMPWMQPPKVPTGYPYTRRDDRDELRKMTRERYATHISTLKKKAAQDESKSDIE